MTAVDQVAVLKRLSVIENQKLLLAFGVRVGLLAIPRLISWQSLQHSFYRGVMKEPWLLSTLLTLQVTAAEAVGISLRTGQHIAKHASTTANAVFLFETDNIALNHDARGENASDTDVDAFTTVDLIARAAREESPGIALSQACLRASLRVEAITPLILTEIQAIENDITPCKYLMNSFEDAPVSFKDDCGRLVKAVRDLGGSFIYWADWLQSRYEGRPLNLDQLSQMAEIPEEIWSQKPSEINAYLKKLRDEELLEPLNKVRAIFIGYGESGKTSLIRKLNGVEVVEGKEKMTPGIEVNEWPVPDSQMRALFWDFGGQVMAHATHQFFLRSSCVYVLVLNARTDINSNQQAEYWLEHIRAFGENSPVLLVGNKLDFAQVNLQMEQLEEAYPNIRGFYPISCTKSFGIDEFKNALVEQLKAVGVAQVKFAKSHFAVLKDLRALSTKEQFLPKESFEKLCSQYGVAKDEALNRDWLLDILDKLGVIIHFPQIKWLNEYILNPRWLTYGVYNVLYSEEGKNKAGHLTEEDVENILQDQVVEDNEGNQLRYPPEKVPLIIEAMSVGQFNICYRLSGEEKMLIFPDLLLSDRPKDLHFDRDSALRFDFDFEGFLPRHLMTMFTVQRHKEIIGNLVWQNGVRLRSANLAKTEALAMADYHQRRFSLWVEGDQTEQYFSVLQDEVLKILERMKLKYVEMLHLSEEARLEGQILPKMDNTLARAEFSDLIAIKLKGISQYVCKNGVYDIERLLGKLPLKHTGSSDGVSYKAKVMVFGDQVMKNKVNKKTFKIGKIESSNVNMDSRLEDVTQSIQTLPRNDDEQIKELKALVHQLTQELEQLQPEHPAEAEQIARKLEKLINEAQATDPDPDDVQHFGKGLVKAAETVRDFVPVAWEAAKRIVEIVENPF